MPAMPPPVADERAGLREYLAAQQYAFHAIAYGLTDEQARATPSVSALSVGALIKHVTNCQRGWMQRVAAAPELCERDKRPMDSQAADYQNEFVMRTDETLADLLAAFDKQNAETMRLLESVDLGAAVPVPHDVPWFPSDVAAWSVRWVFFHMIEELARHAGHGDIIRESIDGATLYELLAGLEDWPATEWLTPWKPPTHR
ncbi:DinB family protein [Mycolicibacterium poriferae]|uniref:DinB family protein n=1 Tax=Mycolicibacterium poriferae TaxID=39694 RepID=UPI0012693E52|nr:DinB family protein [Mycolicibacterium poriferae]MCV7262939.1 DinB family protein [Mycolicibacterium poriferae]QFS90064.1 DinB superfamily protein [Mycobacterium sp. THAF192]